jgi:hypothetical protein
MGKEQVVRVVQHLQVDKAAQVVVRHALQLVDLVEVDHLIPVHLVVVPVVL